MSTSPSTIEKTIDAIVDAVRGLPPDTDEWQHVDRDALKADRENLKALLTDLPRRGVDVAEVGNVLRGAIVERCNQTVRLEARAATRRALGPKKDAADRRIKRIHELLDELSTAVAEVFEALKDPEPYPFPYDPERLCPTPWFLASATLSKPEHIRQLLCDVVPLKIVLGIPLRAERAGAPGRPWHEPTIAALGALGVTLDDAKNLLSIAGL